VTNCLTDGILNRMKSGNNSVKSKMLINLAEVRNVSKTIIC